MLTLLIWILGLAWLKQLRSHHSSEVGDKAQVKYQDLEDCDVPIFFTRSCVFDLVTF